MHEADELMVSQAVDALIAVTCLSARFVAAATGERRSFSVADVSADLGISGPVLLQISRSGGQFLATVACLDFVWKDEPTIQDQTDSVSTLLVKCEPNYPDTYVIAMGGRRLRECVSLGNNPFLQALGDRVVVDVTYKDKGFFFNGVTTRKGHALSFRFEQAFSPFQDRAGATGPSEPDAGRSR